MIIYLNFLSTDLNPNIITQLIFHPQNNISFLPDSPSITHEKSVSTLNS